MHRKAIGWAALLALALVGLVRVGADAAASARSHEPRVGGSPAPPATSPEAQTERDEILMLLAFAIAEADWQAEGARRRRGHNIAAILADPSGRPVFWARNASGEEGSVLRHAEASLLHDFLVETDAIHLQGYSVYSTLEPCAMCAGTMLLALVDRVVWGQSDPEFAGAVERAGSHRGRRVASQPAPTEVRERLEAAHRGFTARRPRAPVTVFLRTGEARGIFADAAARLERMTARYPENAPILAEARDLLEEAR